MKMNKPHASSYVDARLSMKRLSSQRTGEKTLKPKTFGGQKMPQHAPRFGLQIGARKEPPKESFTYTEGIDEFEEDEYVEADYEEVNSGRGTKISALSIKPLTMNGNNDDEARMAKPTPEENESEYVLSSMPDIPDESEDEETEEVIEKSKIVGIDAPSDEFASQNQTKESRLTIDFERFNQLASRRKEVYEKKKTKANPDRKNRILQRFLSKEKAKTRQSPKPHTFKIPGHCSANYRSNDDIRNVGMVDETKYKNFKMAYKAISRRLIQNSIKHETSVPALLLTNKEVGDYKRSLEHKAARKSPAASKSVYERLYNTNTKKISNYVENQAKEIKEREQMESYFKPKTNTSKFGTRRRSHNDFINDITTFNRNKESKIRNKALRKEMEESKIVNSFFENKKRRSRSPNFSKINQLYNQGVQKQLQRSISPESSKLNRSVIPKINKRSHLMVRDQNVSEILYSDAVSRKNRLMERRKSSSRSHNKSPQTSNERNNTNYLVSKISKEMQSICLEEDFGTRDNNLEFTQLVVLLIRMEYISEQITGSERVLVNKLWEILRGEEFGGVSARNFLFFLIGIHQLKIAQLYFPDANGKKSPETSLLATNISNSDIDIEKSYIRYDQANNTAEVLNEYGIQENPKEGDIGIFDKNHKFFFKNQQDQAVAYKLFDEFLQRKASKAK